MGVITTEVRQYQMHLMWADEVSDEPVATHFHGRNRFRRFRLERLDSSETYGDALARLADEWFGQRRKDPDGTIYEVVAVGADEAEDEQYLICKPLLQPSSGDRLRCFLVKEFELLPRLQL